jgi:hypothetical protein
MDAKETIKGKAASHSNQTLRNVLIIFIVLALTVLIYLERHWIRELGFLGYPGAFLVGLVSSAAMFAPVPGLLVLAVMATALNPLANYPDILLEWWGREPLSGPNGMIRWSAI